MSGRPRSAARPDRAALRAARERTVPDVVADGLRLLVCGINPGLWSGWSGHHFARPGNRFWRALHAAGLTPEVLAPGDDAALLAHGIGITNLVHRTTAAASELAPAELRAGARRLELLVTRRRPGAVAVLGVQAYRIAFERPRAAVGRQDEPVGGRPVWVVPNPSGLQAHYGLAAIAALLRAAGEEGHREAARGPAA
jgi:TDG/mug DNA glycosylase family protein